MAKPKITDALRTCYYAVQTDPDHVMRYTSGVINGKWTQDKALEPTRLHLLKGKKVIGWKKCSWLVVNKTRPNVRHRALVELEIAARTPRVQPKNHKCRAASAKVLAIYECEEGRGNNRRWKRTGKKLRRAVSNYNDDFVYRVGERVKQLPEYVKWTGMKKRKIAGTDKFVRDHRECAPGIHFFLTEKEAMGYAL